MRPVCVIPLILIIFVFQEVRAQDEGDANEIDQNYAQTGETIAEFAGELDIDGADVIANPLKRLVKNWPEDLVIAPIPGRSPQFGWQLTLAGGYFLESKAEDSDAPASILGGFVMATENGSHAYGVGGNFHLLDDKLRVNAGAGYGDIRYRLYGIGNEAGDRGFGLNVVQDGPVYSASAKWRVWRKLYVGLGYLGGEIDTRARIALPDNVTNFDPFLTFNLGAYTIPIEYDSRDHEQFPTSGWLMKAKARFFRDSIGSDFDAETFELAVNHYRPAHNNNVLALRSYIRSTSGDAPFFLLSTFGGKTDLRGYESGRYRDKMMYALQSEYRWQVNDSWILTGFAGFGEVAEDVSDFGNNFLPAAGLGMRYVISKKHRVGLSVDIAVGDNGTEFYFGVGEAF